MRNRFLERAFDLPRDLVVTRLKGMHALGTRRGIVISPDVALCRRQRVALLVVPDELDERDVIELGRSELHVCIEGANAASNVDGPVGILGRRKEIDVPAPASDFFEDGYA